MLQRFRWYRSTSSPVFSYVQQRFISCTKNNETKAEDIILSPKEIKLFNFLLEIAKQYTPTTTLRVAGGWVRDKLRHQLTDDIDIVLDNISGATFASYITAYYQSRQLPPATIGVIKINSAKSKHLEVATVQIYKQQVDFVALRGEIYTSTSRIPQIIPTNSPKEDAYRRDLTVNALFYNLHTKEIEDFTGRGREDLRNRLVRTPLNDPKQTFLDDPLRVLRVIRFASNLQYQIDPLIISTIVDCTNSAKENIHQALAQKVSKERIGWEIRKMFGGIDPLRAFQLLYEMKLLNCTFLIKEYDDFYQLTDENIQLSNRRLQFLQQVYRQDVEGMQKDQDISYIRPELTYVETTSAILSSGIVSSDQLHPPYLIHTSPQEGEKLTNEKLINVCLSYFEYCASKHLPSAIVLTLIKDTLKWPNAVAKQIVQILEAMMRFPLSRHSEMTTILSVEENIKLLLWSSKYQGVLFPALTLIFADEGTQNEEMSPNGKNQNITQLQIYKYIHYLNALQLPVASGRRLDGKRVRSIFCDYLDMRFKNSKLCISGVHLDKQQQMRKIGKVLDVLLAWEMHNPDASEQQELEFLQEILQQLKI